MDQGTSHKYTGYLRKVFEHFNIDVISTYSLWNKIQHASESCEMHLKDSVSPSRKLQYLTHDSQRGRRWRGIFRRACKITKSDH